MKKNNDQKLTIIMMMLFIALFRNLNLSGRGELLFFAILFIAYISMFIVVWIKESKLAALTWLGMGIPMIVSLWGFRIGNAIMGFSGLGLFLLIVLLLGVYLNKKVKDKKN